MVGVDAVECQGLRVEVGARKRFQVPTNRLARLDTAAAVHTQDNRRDFQQSVVARVESCGFHIDDDG